MKSPSPKPKKRKIRAWVLLYPEWLMLHTSSPSILFDAPKLRERMIYKAMGLEVVPCEITYSLPKGK